MGRPSIYSQELIAAICLRIAEGESLRNICKSDDMPSAAIVFAWLADEEKKEFLEQYTRAREAQADKYAEEIIEIADDGVNDTYVTENGLATNHDVIARSRLRVDARKWYASKLAPKKYGDKITQEHVGKDGGAIEAKVDLTIAPQDAYLKMLGKK
jgi:hypothetical protein